MEKTLNTKIHGCNDSALVFPYYFLIRLVEGIATREVHHQGEACHFQILIFITTFALFSLFSLFSSMASPASPAVCSTTSYQHFHPLAGFPPAQGWCSTVSLLPERNVQAGAKELAPRDGPCPLGSTLCDLLAELKALDRESAREAWYGILFEKICVVYQGEGGPLT